MKLLAILLLTSSIFCASDKINPLYHTDMMTEILSYLDLKDINNFIESHATNPAIKSFLDNNAFRILDTYAKYNHRKKYDKLLENFSDHNYSDKNRLTVLTRFLTDNDILIEAISNGYLGIVALLLNIGIDVNYYNGSRKKTGGAQNNLDAAIINIGFQLSHIILYGKFCNNTTTKKPVITPLGAAIKGNNRSIAELLLKHGAKVNMRYDEYEYENAEHENTIMIWAAKNGSLETIATLLQRNAFVNASDKNYKTAIMWAAEMGYLEIVDLLLRYRANFNAKANRNSFVDGEVRYIPGLRGYTALIYAAENGHLEVVDLLLKNSDLIHINVKVDEQQEQGFTALMKSIANGHLNIAKLLIENGAAISIEDDYGRNSLSYAIDNDVLIEILSYLNLKYLNYVIEILNKSYDHKVFIEKHAYELFTSIAKNYYNGDVDSVLMKASKERYLTIVTLWLNIDITDKSNALVVTARSGLIEKVCSLLENDTQVNFQDKIGSTALMHAASMGHTEIVKLLLKNDANINLKNKYNLTSLMYATKKGYIEIVKLLLKHNPTINAQDIFGNTALIYASYRGFLDIAKLLLKHKANALIKNNKGKSALDLAKNDKIFAVLHNSISCSIM